MGEGGNDSRPGTRKSWQTSRPKAQVTLGPLGPYNHLTGMACMVFSVETPCKGCKRLIVGTMSNHEVAQWQHGMAEATWNRYTPYGKAWQAHAPSMGTMHQS